jgi:pSer/pThr/pTyr-binding forkhead associated (FHA) protein
MTSLAPKFVERASSSLELSLGAQVVRTISDDMETVTLGRGDENTMVVPETSASRRHANITSRGGRFYLADHSTNGTYVRQVQGDEMAVHRDEILLNGSGFIRLGDPLGVEGTVDIDFATASEDPA